jgi:hypothetical protein
MDQIEEFIDERQKTSCIQRGFPTRKKKGLGVMDHRIGSSIYKKVAAG